MFRVVRHSASDDNIEYRSKVITLGNTFSLRGFVRARETVLEYALHIRCPPLHMATMPSLRYVTVEDFFFLNLIFEIK